MAMQLLWLLRHSNKLFFYNEGQGVFVVVVAQLLQQLFVRHSDGLGPLCVVGSQLAVRTLFVKLNHSMCALECSTL